MKSAALLLFGGVSHRHGRQQNKSFNSGKRDYLVDYNASHNFIKKHIFDANTDCSFDTYVHSWSYDLESELNSLYTPVESIFEDNSLYSKNITEKCQSQEYFGQLSMLLSIQKCSELVLTNGKYYDFIIITRPDIYISKDINLKDIPCNDNILNNCEYIGYKHLFVDFIHIMNKTTLIKFKNMYDIVDTKISLIPHTYQREILSNLGIEIINNIRLVPGITIDVIRKIKRMLLNGNVTLKDIESGGLSIAECLTYES